MGVPVNIKGYVPVMDSFDMAEFEGIPLDPGATGILPAAYNFDGSQTPAANGYTLTTAGASAVFTQAPVTKKYALQAPVVYTSEPILVDVRAGAATNVWRNIVTGNVQISAKFFVAPGDGFSIIAKGKVGSAASKVLVSGGAAGSSVSADIEYDAPYTFYIMGADSNTEGTSLATSGTYTAGNVFTWMLKKKFAEAGKRVRLVDKSKHGYTTQHFEEFRAKGKLALPYQPSVIFWMLGTNNPGRVADNLFQVHVQNTIDYVRWRYPESIVIMCSCVPNGESPAKQTLLANFNTQLQSKITAANTGKTKDDLSYIYYCEMSNLWNKDTGLDVNGVLCYTLASEDSNGKVHGNIYAHPLMAARIWNVIQDNNIHKKMKTTK